MRRSYEKFICLTLMKLTTAVNFINILRARAFFVFWCQNLRTRVLGLRFLGAKIMYNKRGRKTLMKLTPNNKKVDNKKVDNKKVDIKKVDKKEGRQKRRSTTRRLTKKGRQIGIRQLEA